MPVRGASQRSVTIAKERKALVADLYRSGRTQDSIAKELGITGARVCQILRECKEEWVASAAVDIADKIAIAIAELQDIKSRARESFFKSQQDAVTVTTRKMPAKVDPKLKKPLKAAQAKLRTISQEEKRVGQVGDPAFLHIEKDCTINLLKLLNAFPKEDKTEINNIVQFNWQELVKPIPCELPIASTPSSEIEARIRQELDSVNSSTPNSNGNGQH